MTRKFRGFILVGIHFPSKFTEKVANPRNFPEILNGSVLKFGRQELLRSARVHPAVGFHTVCFSEFALRLEIFIEMKVIVMVRHANPFAWQIKLNGNVSASRTRLRTRQRNNGCTWVRGSRTAHRILSVSALFPFHKE
jgi:hypothetical protein